MYENQNSPSKKLRRSDILTEIYLFPHLSRDSTETTNQASCHSHVCGNPLLIKGFFWIPAGDIPM
ncbi:MAG: hypothetical protein GYA51_06965 [Candidatus Methanofastidiosa archaeon]|nr:hypothetical protein [Candidatus Methanofastidiosa archaeon]